MTTKQAPMTQQEQVRRALSRAMANGGGCAVQRVRYGTYRVESSSRPGTIHTVSVDAGGAYRCSCEAGLSGKPCWHQAAVYVAKVEAGGGRVVGPSVPAPVMPANVIAFQRKAA